MGPGGAFKLYEVFKNHLNARIDAVAMYTLINETKYNGLPPDIKKLIDDGGAHFTALWSTLWKTTDDAAIETAKKAGNKMNEMPDAKRDAWRAKLKPVVDKYIDEQAKTLPNARELYDAMVVTLKKTNRARAGGSDLPPVPSAHHRGRPIFRALYCWQRARYRRAADHGRYRHAQRLDADGEGHRGHHATLRPDRRMLAIPQGFMSDQHVAIDVFAEKMPEKLQVMLRVAASFLAVIFLAAVLFYSYRQALTEYVGGDRSRPSASMIAYWAPFLSASRSRSSQISSWRCV